MNKEFNLKNRHFLKIADFTAGEIQFLLELARDLKQDKYNGMEQQRLKGKNIALIFEKTSTRTRCAFEVACFDQGANVSYIDPSGSQISRKETMKDTARILGRLYDAIEYRGYSQEKLEQELAAFSGVPVYNGLTDEAHPTQALTDAMTMWEHSHKPLSQICYSYVGDARNNVAHSLLTIGCLLGMDVRVGAPQVLWPAEHVLAHCQALAKHTGATLTLTEDAKVAVKNTDFIYTDVWVSMGEPMALWADRIPLLLPYQINTELMAATSNPNVKCMHCLPALHNSDTDMGKVLVAQYPHLTDGLEVTEAVFESDACIAFDQAENRLHTIKAVLVATLGN